MIKESLNILKKVIVESDKCFTFASALGKEEIRSLKRHCLSAGPTIFKLW